MEARVSRSAALPVLAVLAALAAGCPPREVEVVGPPPGEGTPPRIEIPVPERRVPAEVRPEVLEELGRRLGGPVRAHFPAYDGDRFYVTFPIRTVKEVTADEVREEIVAPVLEAVGFTRGVQALSRPPTGGLEMARADFRGLAQVVAHEYENNEKLLRPKTRKMIAAMLGEAEPDEELNMALQIGEGMTFAQFVAGIERLEIVFPFLQLEGGVPIEHTLLLASRWEEQKVSSIRGVLFDRYSVVNTATLEPSQAASEAAAAALGKVEGVEVVSRRATDGPHLVLLPVGADASGVTELRFAYRMILRGSFEGQEGPFLIWLDAETADLLKLEPLFADVSARGALWDRDPRWATTSFFQVDPSSGGEYVLALTDVMNRVDHVGDGDPTNDTAIADSMDGSSPTFANFDQTPINDAADALCDSGTNKDFQQVNFFGTIYRYYQRSLWLGIFTPFPRLGGTSASGPTPWSPQVAIANFCNANAGMAYGACQGYYDAACPNYTTGDNAVENFMNFAHENPVIGHELAHNITPRFTSARPSDWCDMGTCSIPVGWGSFHDLADFWADHFDSTNCVGGWVGKNLGGVDASLDCAQHDEGSYLPRLHEVTVPFNPGTPGDHFPEHRVGNTGGYADGQIAAAALWQVRVGMRSKCRPSGLPQFAARYARALKEAGFLGFAPDNSDLGTFQQLYDLEVEMVEQWASSGSPGGPPAFAHNGPHTTNKVTGGFARAGIFSLPYQCLDGDPATGDPTSCPVADGGESGADAVIDVDDNDLGDDLDVKGIVHPEVDFLELSGPAPTFHVWTGPRYRLDGPSGASSLASPAPCNAEFRVQVSTDPTFPPGPATVQSPWIAVDTDPATADPPDCYGTWGPNPGQWTNLQSGGALTLLYYRARTRDAEGDSQRLSTEPGNGLWTVPPPYAVLTADGRSDY